MKHFNARGALIDSTISVIASEGLDKTTTKAIVSRTAVSEAYIYRFFQDKEDLLAKVFAKLDDELADRLKAVMPIMQSKELAFETRSRIAFCEIWKFLIGNEEKCLAFIRYYYSPYFKKHSAAEHEKRYESVKKEFAKAFKAEANVWMILAHILNVMLDFAVRVFNGDVEDNEDTAEHVFRLIYRSVSQYFADESRGQQLGA